eukprot:1141692-Pelagomonas_calceolata.AAC.4
MRRRRRGPHFHGCDGLDGCCCQRAGGLFSSLHANILFVLSSEEVIGVATVMKDVFASSQGAQPAHSRTSTYK